MGMLLKLLCPGDVPAKAHKMIMNDTTNFSYEQVCLEKHHAFIIYSHWYFDGYGKPLVDNTTNQLIEDSRLRIWGEWDRMVVFYEILLRKLLYKHCIFFEFDMALNPTALDVVLYLGKLYKKISQIVLLLHFYEIPLKYAYTRGGFSDLNCIKLSNMYMIICIIGV